jgi:hypothetical protein
MTTRAGSGVSLVVLDAACRCLALGARRRRTASLRLHYIVCRPAPSRRSSPVPSASRSGYRRHTAATASPHPQCPLIRHSSHRNAAASGRRCGGIERDLSMSKNPATITPPCGSMSDIPRVLPGAGGLGVLPVLGGHPLPGREPDRLLCHGHPLPSGPLVVACWAISAARFLSSTRSRARADRAAGAGFVHKGQAPVDSHGQDWIRPQLRFTPSGEHRPASAASVGPSRRMGLHASMTVVGFRIVDDLVTAAVGPDY